MRAPSLPPLTVSPDSDASAAVQGFRSRHHPGEWPAPLVFAQALVQPLAVCILPVMIVTLILALEGRPIDRVAGLGAPLAFLIASVWTAQRLRATIAEVAVAAGVGRVRSVWDAASGRPWPPWEPLLDLRREPGGTYIAIGTESFRFDDADWPASQPLLAALQAARHATPE